MTDRTLSFGYGLRCQPDPGRIRSSGRESVFVDLDRFSERESEGERERERESTSQSNFGARPKHSRA